MGSTHSRSSEIANSIIRASKDGNLDRLKEILESNPKESWRECVKTAIRIASKRGHLLIVEELLLKRETVPNKKDIYGWGALEYACMEGHVNVVDLLTRHSEWRRNRTLLYDTPLHIACKYERVEVVELLLQKKARVDVKNSNLDTPLIIASDRGNITIVELLLHYNAKVKFINLQGKKAINVARDGKIVDLLMKAVAARKDSVTDEDKDDDDDDLPKQSQTNILASYARHKQIKVKAVKCILSGPPRVGKTIFLKRILKRIENIHHSNSGTSQSTGFEKSFTVPIFESLESVPTVVSSDWWTEPNIEEECLLRFLKASLEKKDGHVVTTDDCPHSSPARSTHVSLDESFHQVSEALTDQACSSQPKAFDDPVEKYLEDMMVLDQDDSIWDIYDLEHVTILNLMDTGGQPEFHEILPIILQGPSLHLLFFNLYLNLTDKVDIEYIGETPNAPITYKSNYNTLQMLHQLLSSFYSISKDAGFSTAVLIATHVDLLEEESKKQIITEKNDDLTKEFKQSDFYDHFLTFPNNDDGKNVIFHPVNNMYGAKEEMAKMRNFLTDLIASKRFTSEELPCIWVVFHMILRRRYEKPTGVCTLHQCTELAIECGIEKAHVHDVLEYFHHNLGTVLYYKDVPKLNEIVICDPDILFQRITYLITASFGGIKDCHDWAKKIRTTGEIPEFLFNNVISSSKGSPLTVEHLLNLLTHYNVITKMTYGENEAVKYFMPCLLLPDPQFNITTVTPNQLKSQPLLIKFKGGYIPVGVFSALIVQLSHKWRLDEVNRFRNRVHFLNIFNGTEIELLCRLSYLEVHVKKDYPVIRETVLESLQVVLQSCNHTKRIKHITGFYCPGSSSDNPHFSECTSPAAMLCSQRCPDYQNSVTPGPSIVKWFKEVLTNQESTSSLLSLPSTKQTHSQRLFVWLSEKISVKWKWVGRNLGINDNELDMIQKENPSEVREQAYQMLLLWKRKNENPTYDVLWHSLQEQTTGIDENEFITKVNELEMDQSNSERPKEYEEADIVVNMKQQTIPLVPTSNEVSIQDINEVEDVTTNIQTTSDDENF